MRPHRRDEPGSRWMITNRGLGKRAVFETRKDVELLYELLGEVVALGLLEVHAFVILADGMSVGTGFLPPEAALRAARMALRELATTPLPGGLTTLERDVGRVCSDAPPA